MLTSDRACDLIVVSLISFGLSWMIAQTHGPFGLFGKFRRSVVARSNKEWIQKGVSCSICVSFWVSMAVSLPYSSPATFVELWLVSVGVTCLVVVMSPD